MGRSVIFEVSYEQTLALKQTTNSKTDDFQRYSNTSQLGC
jgi:hypothetical protein